ncbi:unnamed protein product [Closterium sp. NIES-65]|nr:unnamed protein product [Closterium sp. NIES-65]
MPRVKALQSDSRQKIFKSIPPMNDDSSSRRHRVGHLLWQRRGDLSLLLAEEVGPSVHVVGLDFAAQQPHHLLAEVVGLTFALSACCISSFPSLLFHASPLDPHFHRARPGDTALDICCGSGDLSLLLAEKVGPSGRVVGLDFAAQQLVVAAQKQQDSYSARRVDMRWVEGDALALPFDANSFDAVTMGYGLRNVTSIPRALQEIHRVLKAGSSAAILDFNHTEDPLVAAFQSFLFSSVCTSWSCTAHCAGSTRLKPLPPSTLFSFAIPPSLFPHKSFSAECERGVPKTLSETGTHHPPTPPRTHMQEFALQNAVVPVARMFGLSEEYEYLLPSIRRFPTGRQQEQLAKDAGFSKAVHYEIGGGLMGVLVLQK